jgi:hypothetical protein
MKIDLSEDELEVLRCMADAWLEENMRLPGGVSYQQAIDLLTKMGLLDQVIQVEKTLSEFEKECWNEDESC